MFFFFKLRGLLFNNMKPRQGGTDLDPDSIALESGFRYVYPDPQVTYQMFWTIVHLL